jgi:uronate dehydrogenase
MMRVLVTGATGEVGRGVVPLLESQFDLRLLSLDPPGDDPRRVQADIFDWQALQTALQGVEAVLHLAVAPGHHGLYEDDAFNDRRFDVNVKGTFHVFESARRAVVRRVVHVSSVMVTWGHARTRYLSAQHAAVDFPPLAGDAIPSPLGTYALTKALGEQIAEHYYYSRIDGEQPALEVITLRIAAPLDLNDPDLPRKRVRPQQIPFADLAQAFSLALTVPLERYEVVTIVGDSSRCGWSLDAARRVLGYEPHVHLDELGLTFAEPFDIG